MDFAPRHHSEQRNHKGFPPYALKSFALWLSLTFLSAAARWSVHPQAQSAVEISLTHFVRAVFVLRQYLCHSFPSLSGCVSVTSHVHMTRHAFLLTTSFFYKIVYLLFTLLISCTFTSVLEIAIFGTAFT